MNATDISDDELAELAEQFNANLNHYDVDDIPTEIVDVMLYIADNTGLLGDYNTGLIRLIEGGQKLQWYARNDRYFSDHSDLLHWLQKPEQSEVILAIVGARNHPETGEKTPYAEIHPTSRWGGEDEWGGADE